MKVLLLSDVNTLGKKGEIKEVSEGYARNFLIRQGLAEVVTQKTTAMLEARKRKELKVQTDAEKAGRKIFGILNGKKLVVWAKVAGGTTLYSAVSPAIIADRIEQEFKIEIESQDISIEAPIKAIGIHEVGVACTRDLIARVVVHVEALD
jgi:large subunit ribosomal protein L9